MSGFSRYIDNRTIEKKIDQLISDLTIVDQPTPASAAGINRVDSPTIPEILVKDTVAIASNARQDIERVINDITTPYNTDPVFSAYFSSASAQYRLPMDGPLLSNPVPPDNLQKIVERDVYRRQKDPRIILVKDAYRARAQVGAIEYSYANAYNPIIGQNSGIFGSIQGAKLLSVLLHKDQNFIKQVQSYVLQFAGLTRGSLSHSFLGGLSNFALQFGNELSTFTNQTEYLFTTEVDHQYDEYHLLDRSLDGILGSISGLLYGKLMRSQSIGVLFAFKENVLSKTEDMETKTTILSADPQLYGFRQILDQSLMRALQKVETELLATDQHLYQSTEARSHLLGNITQSIMTKQYLEAIKNLNKAKDNTSLSSVDSFQSIQDSIQKEVDFYNTAEHAVADVKALKAATLLKDWSLGL